MAAEQKQGSGGLGKFIFRLAALVALVYLVAGFYDHLLWPRATEQTRMQIEQMHARAYDFLNNTIGGSK